MIKLHYAPLTRSIRVKWLLHELGLSHETIAREYNRDGLRGFAQDTPSGNYPYLEDGDVALSESGAIVQYLLETYGSGRLEPAVGSPQRPAYLYWLHFAEGTASNSINTIVWLTVYRDDADKHRAIIDAASNSAKKIFDDVEVVVSRQDFIAGDEFTAADIMIGFTLLSALHLGVLTDAHAKTRDYVNRLLSRPALQAAIAFEQPTG